MPFRSYLLNSTANPAQFECKWAGLAVLFSRLLLNGTDFFQIFSITFFSKKKIIPQTPFVPTFWPHIISELGGVRNINMRTVTEMLLSRYTKFVSFSVVQP